MGGEDGEEEEEPQLSPWAAGGVLLVVTIAVAVCAEYLVGSIDSLVETAHISKTFIGLILLPPALVLLGWAIDVPMTLHFELFETVVFFLSVLVVTYVIQDGKSNYLEGAMLLGLYIIIALAFLVYPDDATGDKQVNPENANIVARSFWAVASSAGF